MYKILERTSRCSLIVRFNGTSLLWVPSELRWHCGGFLSPREATRQIACKCTGNPLSPLSPYPPPLPLPTQGLQAERPQQLRKRICDINWKAFSTLWRQTRAKKSKKKKKNQTVARKSRKGLALQSRAPLSALAQCLWIWPELIIHICCRATPIFFSSSHLYTLPEGILVLKRSLQPLGDNCNLVKHCIYVLNQHQQRNRSSQGSLSVDAFIWLSVCPLICCNDN